MKQEATVRVRYIGVKDLWVDKLYKSRIEFVPGQVRELPGELGRRFLFHQDIFERVEGGDPTIPPEDTAAIVEAMQGEQRQKDKLMDEKMDVMDRIDQMGKAGLIEYAMINYRYKLDGRLSVASMREQVREMVDRFGVVGGL